MFAVLVALVAGPAAAQGFHPYKPKGYEPPAMKPPASYGVKPAEPYKSRAAAPQAPEPPAFKPWKPSSTTSVFGPEKRRRSR